MGNNFQRAFNIESVVRLTGSMSTLVNVTRQLSNIGRIAADDSISGFEKAGQIIGNVITSVSMAIPAVKGLYDALKKIDLARKGSAAITAT